MTINLQNPARLLLTGLSLFALAACGDSTPAPSNPTGISGVVTAPDGRASSATTVGICPVTETECGAKWTVETDASGAYSLASLEVAPHVIVALKDVNADGVIDLGDHVGFYTLDGQYLAEVTPPKGDVNISMQVIDETTTFPDVAP